MAATPKYKIYTSENEYIGCCKYLEDAALFVCSLGAGATVRDGHAKRHIIWTEGAEDFSAIDSYDGAAEIMRKRIEAKRIRLGD